MKIEEIGVYNHYGNIITNENKQNQQEQSFADIFTNFVADVNTQIKEAKQAKKQIIEGNIESLPEILYKMGKADVSLRLITEIRNKALESYQDIMRMQV